VGFSTITSGFEFSVDTGTNDISGGFAGGTIGYNWQGAGSPLVVGIEVDAA
jgi:outer membrane immunogenic protein